MGMYQDLHTIAPIPTSIQGDDYSIINHQCLTVGTHIFSLGTKAEDFAVHERIVTDELKVDWAGYPCVVLKAADSNLKFLERIESLSCSLHRHDSNDFLSREEAENIRKIRLIEHTYTDVFDNYKHYLLAAQRHTGYEAYYFWFPAVTSGQMKQIAADFEAKPLWDISHMVRFDIHDDCARHKEDFKRWKEALETRTQEFKHSDMRIIDKNVENLKPDGFIVYLKIQKPNALKTRILRPYELLT